LLIVVGHYQYRIDEDWIAYWVVHRTVRILHHWIAMVTVQEVYSSVNYSVSDSIFINSILIMTHYYQQMCKTITTFFSCTLAKVT
jgi:hypothetical protein